MKKIITSPQIIGLLIFNAASILLAFIVFGNNLSILATCAIAYSYGLRHAFDIDHIAAIDNMTRKFMAEKKNPNYLGLTFSLGHSSIVLISSFLLALSGLALKDKILHFKDLGGIIGTSTSAVVLLGLGIVNLATLRRTIREYKIHKAGGHIDHKNPYEGTGFLSRLIYRLFHSVDKSYKMYIVGFLFGLGFDTATEVGILGISFTGVQSGISIWAIMVFPLLFTAGMTLLDATDNLLMVKIYSWGSKGTLRRMRYNISMLSISVALALGIGCVQAFNLLSMFLGDNLFTEIIGAIGDFLAPLGIVVVALFIVLWVRYIKRTRAKA